MEPITGRCLHCIYFENSPAYLEKAFKGLNTLSSGYASIRKDDGLCRLKEILLSARDRCSHFRSE